MKGYDKNKGSSKVKYWAVNNLCCWAMSQKLPVSSFKLSKIFLKLIKAS